MLRFECDYGEGAAPAVLDLMQRTNFDQTPGYGEDAYCAKAAAQIRLLCDALRARSAKRSRSTAQTPAMSMRFSPAWSTSPTRPRSAPFIQRRS